MQMQKIWFVILGMLLSYKDKRMKTSELVNNITDIIDKKIDETY